MAQYRKKPVVVDAFQFLSLADIEGKTGITATRVTESTDSPHWEDAAVVTTIHGQPTIVHLGDWIVAEPVPERFYPCKPDIFAATYESA